MSVSVKPNFRIIENPPSEIDYEAFKEDFLNPHMLALDVKKKHGMTKSMWRDYRQQVLDETGLKEKPHKNHRLINDIRYCPSAEYIQKKPNGYIVVKTTHGKTKYHGRYLDYDTAKMVRDKLYDANWDEALSVMLKEQYGIGRTSTGYNKAKLLFDEFEDKYFNSDKKIMEIREEMDISTRVYKYLILMLREKYGESVRRSPRR